MACGRLWTTRRAGAQWRGRGEGCAGGAGERCRWSGVGCGRRAVSRIPPVERHRQPVHAVDLQLRVVRREFRGVRAAAGCAWACGLSRRQLAGRTWAHGLCVRLRVVGESARCVNRGLSPVANRRHRPARTHLGGLPALEDSRRGSHAIATPAESPTPNTPRRGNPGSPRCDQADLSVLRLPSQSPAAEEESWFRANREELPRRRLPARPLLGDARNPSSRRPRAVMRAAAGCPGRPECSSLSSPSCS